MTTQPSTTSDGLVEVDDAFDPEALPPEASKLHARMLTALLDPADWPSVLADDNGTYRAAGAAKVRDAFLSHDISASALRDRTEACLSHLKGLLALAAAFEVTELRDDEESAQAAALALTGATNVDDIPADVLDRARASVRSGAIVVKRSAR